MHTLILLLHPLLGFIALLCAFWAMIVLWFDPRAAILSKLFWLTTLSLLGVWIVAGYWYVHFYGVDKTMILKGPWPWAHSFFMETKEHLFFIALLLGLYLPLLAREDLQAKAPRNIAFVTLAGIVTLLLYAEGAGAIVAQGAKLAYIAHCK